MKLRANGLDFELLSQGPESAPAVLMVMGLGMQLIAWPEALVQRVLAAGFRVLTFDNRDVGLSTQLDQLGWPNFPWQYARSRLGLAPRPPYGLQDMADDAVGLLDALGLAQAHVMGFSMGGMVAQRLAASHPQRVLSLCSVMSSSGAPGLPGPDPALVKALFRRPPGRSPQAVADHMLPLNRLIASPAFAQDDATIRARLLRAAERAYHPAGVARQAMAVWADRERHRLLAHIVCPTLVLHGSADRLVPIAGGRDTAARIAGSRFECLDGMGHDWPPPVAHWIADHFIPHLLGAPSP